MFILTLIVVFVVISFFACVLCNAASKNTESVVKTENVYNVVARQAEESRVAHYLKQKTLGMMVSESTRRGDEIAGKHWFQYDFKKITLGDWLNICHSVLQEVNPVLAVKWDDMMLEPSSLDSYWGSKYDDLWDCLMAIYSNGDVIRKFTEDEASYEDINESCNSIMDAAHNLRNAYRVYFGRFWDDSNLRAKWAGTGKSYPNTKLNG